jgi:hypothetical protein
MDEALLQLSHISMYFPGIKALDDVHITIKPGEGPCINRRKWCREIDPGEDNDRGYITEFWYNSISGVRRSNF